MVAGECAARISAPFLPLAGESWDEGLVLLLGLKAYGLDALQHQPEGTRTRPSITIFELLSAVRSAVSEAGVRIRAGLLIDHWVAMDNVKSVSTSVNRNLLSRSDVRKASLASYPTMIIWVNDPVRLRHPFKGVQEIGGFAICPDDPDGFKKAIQSMRTGDGLAEREAFQATVAPG